MIKSILLCLTLVCSIAADTPTWAYDAPDGCDSTKSFQSCVQPVTSARACDSSDNPCSCSADDLERKCLTKYCPAVEYTSTAWMVDCVNLGYSYINSDGDYITPAAASATKTASTAMQTEAAASSAAASSSNSQASAQAGSVTSASSPTSTASSPADSKPNAAGHALTFPTGGVLAVLATAAGAMAGMLML